MMEFIYHNLTLMKEAGMNIGYPYAVIYESDERGNLGIKSYISLIEDRTASIVRNPTTKFNMIFSLLDSFIDTKYPDIKGISFHEKYKRLPRATDCDVILRELFRIAKIIRNYITHNPSSSNITGASISVDYNHKKTRHSVNISAEAFEYFYFAIKMYIAGDMGKGNYFLGIIRSIYSIINYGIDSFSDEFGNSLESPSGGMKINARSRAAIKNHPYRLENSIIRFDITKEKAEGLKSSADNKNVFKNVFGLDFYITHKEENFLIPDEALAADFSISESDLLNNWKYEGSFPICQVT